MSSRIKAILLLAWALVRTVLLLGIRKRAGIDAFRANYGGEGLSTVSASQREVMARFGRCIACGLCDRGDTVRIGSGAGQYRSTMALVLSASRSMPDYEAAQASFSVLDRPALAEKERLCPVRVPLTELADFVADHHQMQVAADSASGSSARATPGRPMS